MFLASWVKMGRKFKIAEANQPLATEILISNPVASELFISLFSPSAPSAPSAVKSFRCNRKQYYSLKSAIH